MGSIADNIRVILDKIAAAATACGRSPDEITLLAISKTFPPEAIVGAAEAGLRKFGENRVQEAEEKLPSLQIAGLEWHLVGHLQSNKAKKAAELFDVIHSLDSVKLAERLNRASLEAGKVLSVLLQVDLGQEETKYGADPSLIRKIVESMPQFPALRLNGMMTIPPYFDDPEDARPFFEALRKISERIEMEYPGALGERHLSMGMSHDFEQAIREGATIVRIGTAIFGTRG